MISLAFTRSSYTAALCVIALTCGPPTAAAQQGPPPPDEAARNLQQRCPQLGDTGQSLAALAELLRRTQSGGNYLPVQVAAAAAELRTYASLARRPDVRGIELVPSRPGGRTPDAVIRVRGPGGLLRDMRIEVKTVTGRGPGIQRRAGGGRPVPSRPAETADIKRALRSGFQNTPQRPSQLVAPLRVGGRTIPPGGRLVIHLPRDTRSPTAVADAMRDMASGLRGAPHVQEIEFFRFDRVARRWTIERYVRDPDGSYRTDEPPDGGDPTDGCDGPRPGPTGPGPKPVDATRRAIGDAAAQAPEARAPIPSAAPVLAPRGPGMATTGLPLDDTLGGVDFSSLELRYVSDVSTTRTRAAGFAFTALPGGGDGDGRRTAQRASDAFFVWLALPPRTFTVNLDPGDPDRIVDKQFGRTNPGRVLLACE
jgi:hypothetical protein